MHAHCYPIILCTCADDYGNLTGYVLYESVEQAQRAESTFSEEESMFKVSAKLVTSFLPLQDFPQVVHLPGNVVSILPTFLLHQR